MNTQTLAPPRARLAAPPLFAALPALACGLAALGLVFHEEVGEAVRVWIASTAYNHCFLVIPIAAYLVWDRRSALVGVAPRPTPRLALGALPLGLAWFAAERIGLMEGRQLVALTCVELLFLAVLGWRVFGLLCGPLLYLYFLVPVGTFLTPALQDFTASFVMHGLDLLGVANYTDGYTIQIPEGTFFIAEACAGLRFLIASIAFGCLYALLIYRTPLRRGCFIAAALVVPVIANGFRALGIVTLGHLLGSAQAAETDHVLYGWMFFSIVILILVALGLPFRQDTAAPARAPRPFRPPAPTPAVRGIVAAAASVLALTALGPAAALALTLAAGPSGTALDPGEAGRCLPIPAPAEPADTAAPGRLVVRRYACGATDVTLRAETFSPRTGAKTMLNEEARLIRTPGAEDVTTRRQMLDGLPWRLTQTNRPTRFSAALLWENGGPVEPGLAFRLRQAWRSIAGGGGAPVLVVLTPEPQAEGPEGQRRAQLAIEAFLDADTGLVAALKVASPGVDRNEPTTQTE